MGPGRKSRRLVFSRRGSYCIVEEGFICEQKTNTISCAGTPGTSLNITYANYGRTSQTVCEHPYGLERLHNDTNCRARNSVTIVRGICQDRVACTLKADISLFGHDPCRGVYKYLEVDFECMKPGKYNITRYFQQNL